MTGAVISTLVFPFIYPIIMFKKANELTRRLICFVYCNIAVAIATISYTILINEDVGNIILRIHFRYISSLLVLILLIFFAVVFDRDKLSDYFKSHSHTACWAMIFTVVVSFAFFNGFKSTYIDQFELNWFKAVQETAREVASRQDGEMVFNMAPIIFCAVFLVFGIVGYKLIKHKRYEKFYIGFAVILFFTTFINLYYGHNSIAYIMSASEDERNEIQKVISFIYDLPDDETVLFIYDGFGGSKCYVDTYIDHNDNSYFVNWYFVYDLSNNASVEVNDVKFIESSYGQEYGEIERIDYIVWVSNTSQPFFSNVEVVSEASGDKFVVCKNLDNTTLNF